MVVMSRRIDAAKRKKTPTLDLYQQMVPRLH